MKKTLLALTTILLISACGSDMISTPGGTNSFYDPASGIYTAYPEAWEGAYLEDEDKVKFIMAYITQEPSSGGYFANMTILRDPISNNFSSTDYGRLAVERIRTATLSYKQERYESFEYDDNGSFSQAYIHIFTGKDNFNSSENRYIQTYYTKGSYAYVETFTLPLELESISTYEDIAKFTGFSSRNPFIPETQDIEVK